jgi:hypothetical protein
MRDDSVARNNLTRPECQELIKIGISDVISPSLKTELQNPDWNSPVTVILVILLMRTKDYSR